jgi:SWI/SNF-related matrix-associated actin-dependent regulator 1 of chromatin subfamily A
MELIQQGDRYIAVCSFEEREIAKAAGFRWDPAAKQWWTSREERAAKLARFAAPDLRIALMEGQEAQQQHAEATKAASWATDAAVDLPVPDGLAYLPYQRAGIAFALARPNVLIGDEMGLGKTIQAIGISNADPTIKKVLIVCPASLKLNWAREWQKWMTRKMYVGIARGPEFPRHMDVAIINYEILQRHRKTIDAIAWDLLIVDESHRIKNAKTQCTKAVVGGGKRGADRVEPIRARRRVMLTGTPILNRPNELWTVVHSLDPQGLGADFWAFHKRYCAAYRGQYGWDMSGASHLDELQDRLRGGVMIRRLKADVLTDLPAKRRQIIELDANSDSGIVAAERQAYEAIQEQTARLRADIALADAAGDDRAYQAAVAKLKAVQSVAFAQMSKLRHDTAVAKVPQGIEHLTDAIEASGKVVAFAWHQDVIAELAKEFGKACVVITGQTDMKARQAAVDRFQTDPTCTLFLGNILAAGVGLTLTAASHVVFLELDWRPGIISQAEDRLHRIGQLESVLVQHLVFDGSLDAVMAKKIVAKQAIIDKALDVASEGEDDDDEIDPVELAIAAAAERQAEPRQEAPAEAPRRQAAPEIRLTTDQIAAVQSALRMLSAMDGDRASTLNNAGFNRMDTHIGHELAQLRTMTAKQAALGHRIAIKYRRQLGDDLTQRIKGTAP